MNDNFEKLIDILEIVKSFKDIVITGHIKPDGDAIGSCMALAYCLEQHGKNPIVILEDYSSKYNILSGKKFLYKRDFESVSPEVFITCDCGGLDRITFGTRQIFERAKITINIDHHASNNGFAEYNYVVPEASSTSELIYNLFEGHVTFNKEIATCIYGGIIYDTGGLRFPSTSERTMHIASELMKNNIDYTEIYSDILLKRTIGDVKALSRAIDNLRVYPEGKLSMTAITFEDLAELGITTNELDGVVQFIMNIEEVENSAFIYQIKDGIFKVSLRSTYINMNEIANNYGGGGHRLAAGFTIKGSKEEVYEIVKKHIIDEVTSEQK